MCGTTTRSTSNFPELSVYFESCTFNLSSPALASSWYPENLLPMKNLLPRPILPRTRSAWKPAQWKRGILSVCPEVVVHIGLCSLVVGPMVYALAQPSCVRYARGMALHQVFRRLGYASLLVAVATAFHWGAGSFGVQIGGWQLIAAGVGLAFFVAGGVVAPEDKRKQ